jgi:hypothetical protein
MEPCATLAAQMAIRAPDQCAGVDALLNSEMMVLSVANPSLTAEEVATSAIGGAEATVSRGVGSGTPNAVPTTNPLDAVFVHHHVQGATRTSESPVPNLPMDELQVFPCSASLGNNMMLVSATLPAEPIT